jgi:predicted GNAT family acetyltransferase
VIDGGRVLFKTEVGFLTEDVAQLQGVWINPSLRGQGLAASALAAAIVEIRASCAKTVSLYVNDFNIPARKTYESVGFKQVATFATVLF